MAKLRHIAMSVKDPDKTADFYCKAFDMKRVGTTDSPLAKGVYVSDGTITVALLRYKDDKSAGYVKGEDERGKDYVGLHHIGFWVDDIATSEKQIEGAGGRYFMGRPDRNAPTTFYEMKFRDPNGVPNVDMIQRNIDASVKAGMLDSGLNVRDYVDLSFVEEARRRVDGK